MIVTHIRLREGVTSEEIQFIGPGNRDKWKVTRDGDLFTFSSGDERYVAHVTSVRWWREQAEVKAK